MGKKGVSSQRIENPIEWLKQSRRTHDQNMLKMLITGHKTWRVIGEKLNELKFEKAFKLKPLPQQYTITLQTLNRILNYEVVEDELKRPLFRRNKDTLSDINIRELIESILPNKMTTDSYGEIQREQDSLSYALSRIVIDKVPKMTKLSTVNPGLDTLSSAILTLFSIAQVTEQQIPWLYYIWNRELNNIRIDSLEIILNSISAKSDVDDIESALDEADDKIKSFRAQKAGRSLFEDAYSRIINEDFRSIIRNKEVELSERKKDLRNAISIEMATLKGFSTPLETKIGDQGEALTHWPILSLRADGPIANTHEPLLRNIRNKFKILQHPSIYNICTLLASVERPNRPTAADLEQISNVGGRTAFYSIKQIEPLLVQQYLPSFKKLGLRYRYIFTPKQRPGVLSDGLIERMILLKKEKTVEAGPDIRGCTVHLEPYTSEGPDLRFYETGTYEAVVENEIITLNLDQFDRVRGEWLLTPREVASKRKSKSKGLITRNTDLSNNDPTTLTERQIELFNLLWSIPMAKTQRKWLLDKTGYPQRTANRVLRQLLEEETLRLLYLPALELIGLPDGFIAMAHCHDRRSKDTLIEFMQQNLPFSIILMGDTNHVICHARVAEKKSDIHGAILSEFMEDLADISFVARQRTMKTYRMTALYNIRDSNSREWKDPWDQNT